MTFKKYIAFLLAIFLLFSNVGLAVNLHYCQGKVANATLSYHFAEQQKQVDKEAHGCCDGKEETTVKKNKKDHCCSDEVIKQASDQVVVKAFGFHLDAFVPYRYAPVTFQQTTQLFTPKNTYVAFYVDKNAPPLFKLYRQYLFYA